MLTERERVRERASICAHAHMCACLYLCTDKALSVTLSCVSFPIPPSLPHSLPPSSLPPFALNEQKATKPMPTPDSNAPIVVYYIIVIIADKNISSSSSFIPRYCEHSKTSSSAPALSSHPRAQSFSHEAHHAHQPSELTHLASLVMQGRPDSSATLHIAFRFHRIRGFSRSWLSQSRIFGW